LEDDPTTRDNMVGGEDGIRNNWDQGSWRKVGVEGQ
jgi:hypothetical protein